MSLPLADFQTPVSAASTSVSASPTMLAPLPTSAAAAARSQTVSVEQIADLMSDTRIHINYVHMACDESRARVLAFGLPDELVPDELVPDFEHDLYSAAGQRRLEEARAQVERNLEDMWYGDELGAHSAAGASPGAEGAEDDAASGGGNTWSPGWE
ncbi:hypothetical protein BCR44DRAFT_52048 [Catenaria anguillulae PL171]|uniref:Uncharacterized protein n=1 Tax=Catenaria anguillulae PL171 TaxID=765915 RepID=A0A1Y2H8J3_9FUNG|nr:hypothetical protein BCR44DRAFT_52048 [Catenaria anguillulae PL171]